MVWERINGEELPSKIICVFIDTTFREKITGVTSFSSEQKLFPPPISTLAYLRPIFWNNRPEPLIKPGIPPRSFIQCKLQLCQHRFLPKAQCGYRIIKTIAQPCMYTFTNMFSFRFTRCHQSLFTERTQTEMVVEIDFGKPRIQKQNPNGRSGITTKHVWNQFKVELLIRLLTFF